MANEHVLISWPHLSALNMTDPVIPGSKRPSGLGRSISTRSKTRFGVEGGADPRDFRFELFIDIGHQLRTVAGMPTLIAMTFRSGARRRDRQRQTTSPRGAYVDSRSHSRVEVPERNVIAIKVGHAGNRPHDAYVDKQFEAKVSRIGAAFNPETRLLRVEIDLPNPEGRLLPGMTGSVMFKADK